MKHWAVAIDGPIGAGKSTIARRVAEALGYAYVDTGAMYRALGLYCMRDGIAAEEFGSVGLGAAGADIGVAYDENGQHTYLNGEDVSELIRTPQVADMASRLAMQADVRRRIADIAQEIAANQDVVMDGRDIGSVVLPRADLKIYLDASLEERAARRRLEFAQKGVLLSKERVEADILERDERDKKRDNSPLIISPGATVLDTTGLSPEQVTTLIIQQFRKIAGGAAESRPDG